MLSAHGIVDGLSALTATGSGWDMISVGPGDLDLTLMHVDETFAAGSSSLILHIPVVGGADSNAPYAAGDARRDLLVQFNRRRRRADPVTGSLVQVCH